MKEINKEFIDQLLDLVNLDADSKVRSKSGYGRFNIEEYYSHASGNKTEITMELWYRPTRMYVGMDSVLLRKCYNPSEDNLSEFQSQFYQEVVRYLTGHPDTHKLIQYGKQM